MAALKPTFLIIKAGLGGFEPTVRRSTVYHTSQLYYSLKVAFVLFKAFNKTLKRSLFGWVLTRRSFIPSTILFAFPMFHCTFFKLSYGSHPLSSLDVKQPTQIVTRAALSCGGWTRTTDLQVMSLMSYHFSTPRCSCLLWNWTTH